MIYSSSWSLAFVKSNKNKFLKTQLTLSFAIVISCLIFKKTSIFFGMPKVKRNFTTELNDSNIIWAINKK